MKGRVTFEQGLGEQSEGYVVRAPCDEGFVEAIKSIVPPEDREYDREEKSWWVRAEYLDTLEEAAGTFFKEVEVL